MQNNRLPTRVNNACDRCRRQKIRCDSFRPCFNCVNTKHECANLQAPKAPPKETRPVKRPRYNPYRSSSPEGTVEHVVTREQPGTSGNTDKRLSQTPLPTRGSIPGSTDDTQFSEPSLRTERSIVEDFGRSTSPMDITRQVLQSHDRLWPTNRATNAIPGGDSSAFANPTDVYFPIADLIDVYFFTVHWFSLVVHEPTFRHRYHAITSSGMARTTDRPFLLLLLMVLVMGCHYGQTTLNEDLRRQLNLEAVGASCLRTVRQHFVDLLEEDSIEFIQICILLGAAVKSAQAFSLHRQAKWRRTKNDLYLVEERKRVWWTIYTWDRFATVVYGRPLSLSDKHCNVDMPGKYTERMADIQTFEIANIELCSYQIQLNKLYQITSSTLENIHGNDRSDEASLESLAASVRETNASMQIWEQSLPTHLDLNQQHDLNSHSSLEEKMHKLQSLSLRLTYLNLVIIIHRPLLLNQQTVNDQNTEAQTSCKDCPERQGASACESCAFRDIYFQNCLAAALSISNIEQRNPYLIRLAGSTHLQSFLGMNVFTSSIVCFICAMSNVLSDIAQQAKRGLSRNLRLLKSLSDAGSLSSQCGIIVEDLIQIILEKERTDMLVGPVKFQQGILRDDGTSENPDNNYDGSAWMPSNGTTSRDESDDVDSGSRSRAQPFDNQTYHLPDPGVPVERTLGQLNKVLRDATKNQVRQNKRLSVQGLSGGGEAQFDQTPEVWPTQIYQNTMQGVGDGLQAEDFGQFWLWNSQDEGTSDVYSSV